MQKTILITGATDGIGLETATLLAEQGHRLLLHGRNPAKLQATLDRLSGAGASLETYAADLSNLNEVERLAQEIAARHQHLDVVINNAGVYKTAQPLTADDMDVRFVVNTIAPYLLTQRLMSLMDDSGRVVNLSSAAQSTVDLQALTGQRLIPDDFAAYGQSKLAITMWSRAMGQANGPIVIAVNPGSLLASKMVKEGFGVAGNDLRIGADILCRAALSDEFASASGCYYDNDAHQFAEPHPDALNDDKVRRVVDAIEEVIARN